MKTKKVLKKLKALTIEQQARVACLAADDAAHAAAHAVRHAIRAGVKKSLIIKLIDDERGPGEINLDEYETEPIDYTGCHPVIAESLRRGKGIVCRVGSFETKIVSYDETSRAYVDHVYDHYHSAEPIEKKETSG